MDLEQVKQALAGIGQGIKEFYYFFEDRWYDSLDWLNQYVPVYKVIDPVDKVVPSFIVFLLFSLLILMLIGYVLQFSSAYIVTLSTYDIDSKKPISAVMLKGTLNGIDFEEITDGGGVATTSAQGSARNIYGTLAQIFFPTPETFSLTLSAEKANYESIVNKAITIDGRKATIYLKSIPGDAFGNTIAVKMIDAQTKTVIIDPTASAYLNFGCANKTVENKHVLDEADGSADGVFRLNEENCQFVVTSAHANGFQDLAGIYNVLPVGVALVDIELTKIPGPQTRARVYVNEKGVTPEKRLGGINVKLYAEGVKYADEYSDASGIMEVSIQPGTYTITAASIDGNYVPINIEDAQTITVTANQLAEKTISLTKRDPQTARILKLRIVDANGSSALSGAKMYVQRKQTLNGITSVVAQAGYCANQCISDSNGIISFNGLSTLDEGKVIASIAKQGYLYKVIAPTLFKTTEGPQLVALTRADANNSGSARIRVKSGSNNMPLSGAPTFLYMDVNDPQVDGVMLTEDGIPTDATGEAVYTGLTQAHYAASATYKQGTVLYHSALSAKQAIGVTEEKIFDVNINFVVSTLRVQVLTQNGAALPNPNQATVQLYGFLNGALQTPFLETLHQETTGSNVFVSGVRDATLSYYVAVDANGYVPNSVIAEGLVPGANTYYVRLYNVGALNDQNVNVFFNGFYKNIYDITTGTKATFLDANNALTADGTVKGYYDRVDVVLGKELPITQLFGALRVSATANLRTIAPATTLWNPQMGVYKIAPVEKRPVNDDNYYVQDVQNKISATDVGVQAAIAWQPDGGQTLPKGTYSFAMQQQFAPTVVKGSLLDFNSSAKEKHASIQFEDRKSDHFKVGTAVCDQGSTECSKLFFSVALDSVGDGTYKDIGAENAVYASATKYFTDPSKTHSLIEGEVNRFKVSLFNNGASDLAKVTITAYSYSGAVANFSMTSAPSGSLRFDSNEGPLMKVIGDYVVPMAGYSSPEAVVGVYPTLADSTNYLVFVADTGTEKYTLFIDTKTPQKIIGLTGNFLAGVKDQNFGGFVYISDTEHRLIASSVTWETKKNCLLLNPPTIAQGVFSVAGSEVSGVIPGIYAYQEDCIDVTITPQKTVYKPATIRIMAGTGQPPDAALACLQTYFVGMPTPTNAYINWQQKTQIMAVNKCDSNLEILIQTGLVVENNACATIGGILGKGQSCSVTLIGQNASYVPATPFSDVLGVFPVYVQARFANDTKMFSNAAVLKVHVANPAECFSLPKDIFDFRKTASAKLTLKSNCQSNYIPDYYYPRTSLSNFAGLELKSPVPQYNYIDFNYIMKVTGGGYTIRYDSEPVEYAIPLIDDVGRHPATPVRVGSNDLMRYTGFSFEVPDFNGTTETLFFRWEDYPQDANMYGAKIDGNMTIKYRDGHAVSVVTPIISFDVSKNPIECSCAGVAQGDSCAAGRQTGAHPLHCIVGDQPAGAETPNVTYKYGLGYIDIPKGNVEEISFNLIGTSNPKFLTIKLYAFVNATKVTPVSVPNNSTVSNYFGGGIYRIAPIENGSFVLKRFGETVVDPVLLNQQTLCQQTQAYTGWIDTDANYFYWTTPFFMAEPAASTFCQTPIIAGAGAGALVDGVADISASVKNKITYQEAHPTTQASISWIAPGQYQGFWTRQHIDTNYQTYELATPGTWGAGKADVAVQGRYAPLCKAQIPASVIITDDACAEMDLVCDPTTHVCLLPIQVNFNNFIAPEFANVQNPTVEFVLQWVKGNGTPLNNSSVSMWLKGGLLKAAFMGEDYAPFNTGTMDYNLVDIDLVGDQYGTTTPIDYVNQGKAHNGGAE